MHALLTNSLAFVFALGVIIFVHEAGHLILAKVFDTRVYTFSLGFGKRLWGFKWGETDYRISLVPLGGYVQLGGENPGEATGDPRELVSKPRWQRILIYLAGPVMNIVLAIALVAGLFMVGIELPNLVVLEPIVGSVEEGSQAAQVGILPGDRVLEAGGEPVENWDNLVFTLMTSPERAVALKVARGDQILDVTLTPHKVPRYEIGDMAGLVPQALPQITQLVAGGAAEAAGLEAGDRLITMDGRQVADVNTFIQYIQEHPGQVVNLAVRRGDRILDIPVTPGDFDGIGRIGAGVGYVGFYQRFPMGQAVVESVKYNWFLVDQTFAVLGKIFNRELSAKGALAGPIEIAAQSGAAARRGFKHLIHLMAYISISIAILNLMPIPILDGGQMLILLVESAMRRDLSLRFKEIVAQVGFVMIMLLMLVVIYFDISKTWGGSG